MNNEIKDYKVRALQVKELLYRAHIDCIYFQALAGAIESIIASPDAGEEKRVFSLPMSRWIRHIQELLKIDMANCIWKVYLDNYSDAATIGNLVRDFVPKSSRDKTLRLSKELIKYEESIRLLRKKYISHSDQAGTSETISVGEMKTFLDDITRIFNGICKTCHFEYPVTTIEKEDLWAGVYNIEDGLKEMVEKISYFAPSKLSENKEYTEAERKIIEQFLT